MRAEMIQEKKKKSDFNEYGIDINGLNRDGYNINGIDENGLDRDGYNINGINRNGIDRDGYKINDIEGTIKKYPQKKLIGEMMMMFCMTSMGLIRQDLIKMVMTYMDLI